MQRYGWKRMKEGIRYLIVLQMLPIIMVISSCSLKSTDSGTETAASTPAELTPPSDTRPETETPRPAETTTPVLTEPETESLTAEQIQPQSNSREQTREQVPALPSTGRNIMDFIPKNWELMDSVKLDYNEDGITDYVGVLQCQTGDEDSYELPRILFAVYSEGTGRYRLDFQDANLIRGMYEGGTFGDPYLPLTGEKRAFTTHAYGGSAWRWSEDYTYTYKEGTWYLTGSQEMYGYGFYVTSYSMNDYEAGTGIRKKRSDEFEDMESALENAGETDAEDIDAYPYDLIYEVTLDPPPTLYQAGMRWWLAPYRMTEWPVDTVEIAQGIALEPEQVKLPGEDTSFGYHDEAQMLYKFSDEEKNETYIALYEMKEKRVSVLAAVESDRFHGIVSLYKGKVLYSTYIMESELGGARSFAGGTEEQADDEVGLRLHQINVDGTQQVIFEYLPEWEQRERYPYLDLICEINGGELTAEIYIGGEPHPFYGIDLDSGAVRYIGQVPKE